MIQANEDLSLKHGDLPTPRFHMEITRSKPDHLDEPLFGASHGLVWTLWVTWQ
jgi:hypothetical protein